MDETFRGYNLYLSSKSPRRSELMTQAGFKFKILNNEVPEDYPADLTPENVPEYLARKKAEAALAALSDDKALVIGADSVVILKGDLIGKPVDEDDARNILKNLSGEVHIVVTGVALVSPGKQFSFSEVSEVNFANLTDSEINFYIKHYSPMDKAGAYGIQDWIGLCRVHGIKGSYSNIMGLPMAQLYEALCSF